MQSLNSHSNRGRFKCIASELVEEEEEEGAYSRDRQKKSDVIHERILEAENRF